MGLLTLTILLFLSYIFLYSILPYLFASAFSSRKTITNVKVAILTYSAPLVLIAYFLLRSRKIGWPEVIIVLVFGGLATVSAIYSSKKYLTRFQLTNDWLEIEYLLPSFNIKKMRIPCDSVKEFEIIKRNWLTPYPASLSVILENSSIAFQLIDKQRKKTVVSEISTFNMTSRD